MNSFEETGLKSEILEAIKALGFEKPTPIQEKSIPLLLQTDKDLIALAQTGTGKTAAFGLPVINETDLDSRDTQTLILCPTRELCLQITKDLASYSKFIKGLSVLAVYGGSSIDTQVRALKRGAQIVVGTPGRTVDLIKRRKLILGQVKVVVLDEADEMLSMGFSEDLDFILGETPKEKQTLLFSATMSKRVEAISKKYMADPERVSVAAQNLGAENVEHIYYAVSGRDKYEALKRVCDMNPDIYGIIFCRTRRDTQEIAGKLMADSYSADAIHGDMSQAQRDEVMNRFRKKRIQMLVATDVVARGLDVDDLTHVINHTLPDDPEVYVHRSGRTGRAGKSGVSVVLVSGREKRRISDIERLSKIRFIKGEVPTGQDICERQLLSLIDRIKNVKVDEAQIEPFLPSIFEKFEDLSREDIIKHFVSAEFNTFFEYYKNAQDLKSDNRKSNDRDRRSDSRYDSRDRDERRGRRGDDRRGSDRRGSDRRGSDRRGDDRRGDDRRGNDRRRNELFTRLFINLGGKNDLHPGRLMGLINDNMGSKGVAFGKIEILKKFSFFEVGEGSEKSVMDALNGLEVEGVKVSVEVSEGNPEFKSYNKDSKPASRGKGDRGFGKKMKADFDDYKSRQDTRKQRRKRV